MLYEKQHRYALLLGGDVTNNLDGAVEEDLVRVAKILTQEFRIQPQNVFVVAQTSKQWFLLSLQQLGITQISFMNRANLVSTMNRLVSLMNDIPGHETSYLQIHYSGHGLQIEDTNGDEMDGMDEAITVSATDFFLDDDFKRLLFDKLPGNNTCMFLMDQCHSGNFGDMPYAYDPQSESWSCMNRNNNEECRAKIYTLSACADDQVDYQINYRNGKPGGMLTVMFVEGTDANGMLFRNQLDNMETLCARMNQFARNRRVGNQAAQMIVLGCSKAQ
jgi:hypothetical protein